MHAKFDKGSNPWSSMFGPGASGFGKPNFRWRIFDRGDLKYMICLLYTSDAADDLYTV